MPGLWLPIPLQPVFLTVYTLTLRTFLKLLCTLGWFRTHAGLNLFPPITYASVILMGSKEDLRSTARPGCFSPHPQFLSLQLLAVSDGLYEEHTSLYFYFRPIGLEQSVRSVLCRS